MRLTGKAYFGAGSTSVQVEWAELDKRPDMQRDEITMQGLTAISGFDGSEGWNFDPFGGRREADRASEDEASSPSSQISL